MNQPTLKQSISSKAHYEKAEIDVVRFSCADIIATSEKRYENQGVYDKPKTNMLLG